MIIRQNNGRRAAKSGMTLTIRITTSLYLILLIFFLVMSSSAEIDPHRIKKVIGSLDEQAGNFERKRTFLVSSLAGTVKLNPEIVTLIGMLKNSPKVSSFVSNDKIVIQCLKRDFYDPETNRIFEDVAEIVDSFFKKLVELSIRTGLKLELEFSLDARINSFDADKVMLGSMSERFSQLGFTSRWSKFFMAVKKKSSRPRDDMVTISLVI